VLRSLTEPTEVPAAPPPRPPPALTQNALRTAAANVFSGASPPIDKVAYMTLPFLVQGAA